MFLGRIAVRRTVGRNPQARPRTEAARRRQGKGELCKMETIQAEMPRKDLSLDPEPYLQFRRSLLEKERKKGKRESIRHHVLRTG